jgi:hypothetical protein
LAFLKPLTEIKGMDENALEHVEHREHAEHAAHSGSNFIQNVSVTIAILAVLAAVVGSLETIETSGAISAKNTAVIYQARASDQWAFFQAKSVKKNMYDIAIQEFPQLREEYAAKREKYAAEATEIQAEAKKLEHESQEMFEQGDHHEHRHHVLTIAATLLHIAIAIATISIISKGLRWPWQSSIVLSVIGVIVAGFAYF